MNYFFYKINIYKKKKQKKRIIGVETLRIEDRGGKKEWRGLNMEKKILGSKWINIKSLVW